MKIKIYNPRKPEQRSKRIQTTRQKASKYKNFLILSVIVNVILAGYIVYINN